MRVKRLLQPDILIPLLALFARIIPGPRTIDDAYITYRYAQNLISGEGLVFNPGELVLGTTTPLFSLLLSGFGLISGGTEAPFPLIALGINAISDAITCWLLIQMARTYGFRKAGLAAGLLWAISPMSVTFAIGGMETSFYILLIAATFYFHSTDRPVLSAFTGGLSFLTRPDALLFLAPLGLERLRVIMLKVRTARSSISISNILLEFLVFAGPVLGWSGYSVFVFGNLLPHSILAKMAAYHLPPEAGLVRLLQHYSTPFQGDLTFGIWGIRVGIFLYPSLYILGARRLLKRRIGLWPLFAFPGVYFLAFAVANPLIFRWYLAPPLPFYFLVILIGLEAIIGTQRPPSLFLAVMGVLAVFSLRAWTIHPDHGPDRPAPKMAFIKLELLYEEVAKELKERPLRRNEVIAAGDIGAIGYFSEARILDTLGLISPEAVSYYPLPASSYVSNYAIPSEFILDERPDYLVFPEVYGRNTLLKDPLFDDTYELLRRYPTDIYGSNGMLVYRIR